MKEMLEREARTLIKKHHYSWQSRILSLSRLLYHKMTTSAETVNKIYSLVICDAGF